MALFIVSIFIALGVSFLCSLLEAVVLSLTPAQIAAISSKHPDIGKIWHGFKTNIERPLTVILVMNTAAHTIGASVAGSQFNRLFGNKWIWLFSLVFTFLMLQFTEILPKTIGVRLNRKLAGFIALPLNISINAFTPLIKTIHWINSFFEGSGRSTKSIATADEIIAMAGLSRLSNQIDFHQERIIKGACRLASLTVQQVMIPIEDISFISTSQTISQAVIAAHLDCHTRYPVREGDDFNNVIGYVNFKEMIYFMSTNPGNLSLRGIIRPVCFVLPEYSAADLMKMFVDQHIHIAIVQDKNGKTLGMVALEDLVEELVGELEDEFDRLPQMFHSLDGGTWMVGGGMRMANLSGHINLPMPDSQETLSAWLSRQLGHKPKPGEIYRQDSMEFIVRRLRRGKIFEVAIRRLRDGSDNAVS
ncbi:MAG: hemolysin family protein [Phycisphaerae bacterium]|jgi:CBS domain containing-hemolysin-like protein